jgi:hypothetical protein
MRVGTQLRVGTTFPLSKMMTRMEENRKNIPRDKPNEGATAGCTQKIESLQEESFGIGEEIVVARGITTKETQ